MLVKHILEKRGKEEMGSFAGEEGRVQRAAYCESVPDSSTHEEQNGTEAQDLMWAGEKAEMEKRDLGKGEEMFMGAPPTYGQVMKEA